MNNKKSHVYLFPKETRFSKELGVRTYISSASTFLQEIIDIKSRLIIKRGAREIEVTPLYILSYLASENDEFIEGEDDRFNSLPLFDFGLDEEGIATLSKKNPFVYAISKTSRNHIAVYSDGSVIEGVHSFGDLDRMISERKKLQDPFESCETIMDALRQKGASEMDMALFEAKALLNTFKKNKGSLILDRNFWKNMVPEMRISIEELINESADLETWTNIFKADIALSCIDWKDVEFVIKKGYPFDVIFDSLRKDVLLQHLASFKDCVSHICNFIDFSSLNEEDFQKAVQPRSSLFSYKNEVLSSLKNSCAIKREVKNSEAIIKRRIVI